MLWLSSWSDEGGESRSIEERETERWKDRAEDGSRELRREEEEEEVVTGGREESRPPPPPVVAAKSLEDDGALDRALPCLSVGTGTGGGGKAGNVAACLGLGRSTFPPVAPKREAIAFSLAV